MKSYTLPIIIERDAEGFYVSCPPLQCVRENWSFGNPVERRVREYSPGGAN